MPQVRNSDAHRTARLRQHIRPAVRRVLCRLYLIAMPKSTALPSCLYAQQYEWEQYFLKAKATVGQMRIWERSRETQVFLPPPPDLSYSYLYQNLVAMRQVTLDLDKYLEKFYRVPDDFC